ncbi:uncharacterized protein [Procambarus clarkii]|uniref:uncharacterized protein isoform X2 n=1 Tax=Procambarus clarkii TaxID=6728 RepID=UPI001E671C8A|nr:uncharacterized protein LOC123766008 isoform X2 [Procambarus clarkii]
MLRVKQGNSRVLLTSTSRPRHVLKREVALLKRGNLVTSPSPYPPQEGTTCAWESAVYWMFSLGNGCNAARLRPVCQLGLEANPQDICDVCKQLAP